MSADREAAVREALQSGEKVTRFDLLFVLAELAAARERERAQHEALLAQAREIRAARDQIENEIPWTKDGAYEALREREEKLREALREIVRYFDSYGLPPAGLPLGLARAALSEGEG